MTKTQPSDRARATTTHDPNQRAPEGKGERICWEAMVHVAIHLAAYGLIALAIL